MSTFVDKCAIILSMALNECGISRCEWEVMALLWSGPMTSSQICVECGREFGWSASTVKTFISRLLKKGYVRYEKKGRRFEYAPAKPEKECVMMKSRDFAGQICKCGQKAALMELISECSLSGRDVEELKAALDKKALELKEKREGGCGSGCGC